MKIPTKVRYGLRFMANIANYFESGRIVPISKIAGEEGISSKYLEQIISAFINCGYIRGWRGKSGGYQLLKDPKKITAYEVALALGEDLTFVPCVKSQKECYNHLKSKCKAGNLWSQISSAVIDIMKSKTLVELNPHN